MDWWTSVTRNGEPEVPLTHEERRQLIDQPFPTFTLVDRHSHGGVSLEGQATVRQSSRDRFSHPHEKEDGER